MDKGWEGDKNGWEDMPSEDPSPEQHKYWLYKMRAS